MNACALTLLENTARRLPDKLAIVDEHDACTFSDLEHRARRIGSALISRGLERSPVIVLLDKGVDALAAMLGVLYAGGCYVPIDPIVAKGRLGAIRRVLESPAAITCASALEKAAVPRDVALDVNELANADIDERALTRVRARLLDTDPAYVIFTSGSTGVPKGVAVSHRSIVEFIGSFTKLFGIGENDVIANQAPFDFDVSVKDIYGALATGATIQILPRHLFSAPARLVATLVERRVTTLTWAVAALCLVSSLHALDGVELPQVRRVLFSGETMPVRHLATWLKCAPRAEFVNLYGPTEVTCNCLYHRIDRSRDYTRGIPLGRPFPNHEVLLLDEKQRPVTEAGGVGELYVRTPQLALGYMCDAARTTEAFVQNPLNRQVPETVYRTGDLARLTDTGELVFCGRRDNQIKHLGHRIELEEIDGAIERLADVARCRCAYEEQRHRLYAFYEGRASPEELARVAQRSLPAHLVPNAFVPVERMPLTKNGKVDRRALLVIISTRRRGRQTQHPDQPVS